MSKQIIIIDSAEALAEQIAEKLSMNAPHVVAAIAAVLHPIEVPSDAEGLIDKLEKLLNMDDDIYPPDNRCDAAAALITAHSRTVPRAMLEAVYGQGIKDMEKGCGSYKTCIEIAEQFGYHAE